jgi:hypothetical protein
MLCPRIAILRYAGNRRSNAAYYPLPYVSLSYVRFRHVASHSYPSARSCQ